MQAIFCSVHGRYDFPHGLSLIGDGQSGIVNGRNAIVNGRNGIIHGRNEIIRGQFQIGDGQNQILYGRNQIVHGRNEIIHGQFQIGDGRKEILYGRNQIVHGRNQIIRGQFHSVHALKKPKTARKPMFISGEQLTAASHAMDRANFPCPRSGRKNIATGANPWTRSHDRIRSRRSRRRWIMSRDISSQPRSHLPSTSIRTHPRRTLFDGAPFAGQCNRILSGPAIRSR